MLLLHSRVPHLLNLKRRIMNLALTDTYTIEEAVKDGATTQILYEGREADIKVTGVSLDSLDEYFSDKTEEEKTAIKKNTEQTELFLKLLSVYASLP